jgi:hypothetical protein
MNKFQTKQVNNVYVYVALDMHDTAARSLSALIRSSMTDKAKKEMLVIADKLNLSKLPEFII